MQQPMVGALMPQPVYMHGNMMPGAPMVEMMPVIVPIPSGSEGSMQGGMMIPHMELMQPDQGARWPHPEIAAMAGGVGMLSGMAVAANGNTNMESIPSGMGMAALG
jgi:hypothetical protein